MLKAIIFDFNGVIIDDEPLHFLAFREVFEREGIILTEREYYGRFLAFDDRTCIQVMVRRTGRKSSMDEVFRLRQAKSRSYDRLLKTRLRLFPGAVSFIRQCAKSYSLAIASGALRTEIQFILRKFSLGRYFQAVVSADDVIRGKPHPETFLRAWRALRQTQSPQARPIQRKECLVIEDSLHGIEAAHRAGMRCAAVAHSYPLERLHHADFRARSVRDLRLARLEALFE